MIGDDGCSYLANFKGEWLIDFSLSTTKINQAQIAFDQKDANIFQGPNGVNFNKLISVEFAIK